MLRTLDDFINGCSFRDRNAYVKEEGFYHLYVRYGDRYINGVQTSNVLDLANFEAKIRGTGLFTRLIERIRTTYPDVTIYVECVINPRLPKKLKSLGFKAAGPVYPKARMIPNSYYLSPK